MPPRRSTAASTASQKGRAPARATRSTRSTVSVTDWSATQDDESAVSVSSDSMPDIIQAKKTVRGAMMTRTPKVKNTSDDELVLVHTVARQAVKKNESDDEVMLISDNPIVSTMRKVSPTKKSRVKVRPPTPGTPEYDQLGPVTFSQDYYSDTQDDDSSVSITSAKRIKPMSGTASRQKQQPTSEKDDEGHNVTDSEDNSNGSDASDESDVSSNPFIAPKLSVQKGKTVGNRTFDKGKGTVKKAEDAEPAGKIVSADKGKDKVTQINKDTVYLEDVMKPRFVRDKDEDPEYTVMKVDQDYVIAETYENLPWLKWGELLPWASNDRPNAPSLVWFQIWQEVLEPYDEANLFRWLTFQQSGRYVNMSRCDPEKVTVSNFGSQRFVVLPGQGTQCICVSLILVDHCSLVYGRPFGKSRNKKIGGVLHIQEHERLASHFCMQYNLVSHLNANMFGWVLYFNTRDEDFMTKSRPNSPVKGAKDGVAAPASPGFNFFSKYPGMAPRVQERSPSKSSAFSKPAASRSYKPFKSVLDYNDTVPIYDGRNPDFNPLLDLDMLGNLPLWPGDAPKNSLAAVGYTAHTYKTKDRQEHLSLNVQWVVVLGVCDVGNAEGDFY